MDVFSADDTCATGQGTPAFQPPEIAMGVPRVYGFKVDVWSCGVTLYNITTGLYPFDGENIYKLFEVIGRGEYQMPADLDESLKHLIREMLKKDPEERASLQAVRSHRWVLSKPERTMEYVCLPPKGTDEKHSMTTLPFLHDHHYGQDEQSYQGGFWNLFADL